MERRLKLNGNEGRGAACAVIFLYLLLMDVVIMRPLKYFK